ncbi:MAG: L-glutamate gamma-semialdehyde dehydrogenase [Deltaproteobacteria bacterium CG11_big_fil_rev_8_21_14_0_20_47_16]|nr:MAG: L-glutamate gamma-semialdehyde dehydrogenase [Deltaproteobacteria bacterium CG11_big_fil_rev_8_21_14_0_20_47_16]
MSQDQIFETGKRILDAMKGQKASIFDKSWWTGKMMDWAMQKPEFKVSLFRFVDVLPYLNSSEQVGKHLKEYFMGDGQELPPFFQWGIGSIAATGIGSKIAGTAIKKNIEQMARQFIVGENANDALKGLHKITDNGYAFTVDILGEAALSETESRHYQNEYLNIIRTLHAEVPKWKSAEKIRKPLNVSVKLSAIYSQINPAAFDHTVSELKKRLLPIFQLAKELGVFINLDMESYAHKAVTLQAFKDVVSDPSMAGYTLAGIAMQAYLRDTERDVADLIAWTKEQNVRITVRLVKGAYWDYEALNASQKDWPCPVFINKADTDASFERITALLLQNNTYVGAAIASHNVRSIAHAMVCAKDCGLDANAFEFQTLFGMAEPIKQAIIQMGYQVREYAPVGALIPGMAYLVRRLLENTSNESWLKMSFADETSIDTLLATPVAKNKSWTPPHTSFANIAVADFGDANQRDKMIAALRSVKSQLGRHYPLIIGGKSIDSKTRNTSVNPTHPDQIIGTYAMADTMHADQAIAAAQKAFQTWRYVPVKERATILRNAADIAESRRFELSAMQVLEVGKPWAEADADVCEAIDFLRYYAQEMERIASGDMSGSVPGETNWYHYIPKGVGVVIAPWNFPLAISMGMVAAGLVTGNCIIYKPSEQSTIVGTQLMALFTEAGLPDGVLNFLPGKGSVVGNYLVENSHTSFVTFTGSREVGLSIIQHANHFEAQQDHVKRIVAEMGGKNAIIVDADADLDEAVAGVLKSAFGFSGQKCSACSRAIVLEENYDRFVERLVDATKSMVIGDPIVPETVMGPVIDHDAQTKILSYIEKGSQQSHMIYQGSVPTDGYFVPPTIFTDVKPDHSIAQEEIFGPVLAIIKVKTFEDAIAIANGTPFALTGGVYSRSPINIEIAKRDFNVGNLYINRPCTGAIVHRHPFGGFKLSGVGSKAGGPDYLLQFMEPRNISENTMRRGFAPEMLEK